MRKIIYSFLIVLVAVCGYFAYRVNTMVSYTSLSSETSTCGLEPASACDSLPGVETMEPLQPVETSPQLNTVVEPTQSETTTTEPVQAPQSNVQSEPVNEDTLVPTPTQPTIKKDKLGNVIFSSKQ